MGKIQTPFCREAADIIKESRYFRMVLFGASNTERYLPMLHWGDVLETGIQAVYGRKFHLINSGKCGCTTAEAMLRFDRDVTAFEPKIVIVTLGGNDCNPDPAKFVSEADFAANLEIFAEKIRAMGAYPIFQTYYKMDLDAMDPVRGETFLRYMDCVRRTARKTGTFLVDQYAYFDALPFDTLRYKLLLNAMHVNDVGNSLIGVILLHHLGIDPSRIWHHDSLLYAMQLYNAVAEDRNG